MGEILQPGEKILRQERCWMRHRRLKDIAQPTPWPSYNTEKRWQKKRGELVLTNKRLLFLDGSGRDQKFTFAIPLQGLTISIVRAFLASQQLEVLVGTNPYLFTVKNPQVWVETIRKQTME